MTSKLQCISLFLWFVSISFICYGYNIGMNTDHLTPSPVSRAPPPSLKDQLPTEYFKYRPREALNKKIHCNVELNCESLEAIGFDMDFTLARYTEDFNELSFKAAKNKLHKELNYPAEVLTFKYNSDAFYRGLIIDKRRGNILKVDRHKLVHNAFHGNVALTKEQKKDMYTFKPNKGTFNSEQQNQYITVDTMFLLIDVALFTQLVDLKDQYNNNLSALNSSGYVNTSDPLFIVANKSYADIYEDIRVCVDKCHNDGAIKNPVMKNPAKYILADDSLVPMLLNLKAAGKKLFLLTNSYWQYTNAVMKYLVGPLSRAQQQQQQLNDTLRNSTKSTTVIDEGRDRSTSYSSSNSSSNNNSRRDNSINGSLPATIGNDTTPPPPSLPWYSLFDVVVVGAQKPEFLTTHDRPLVNLGVTNAASLSQINATSSNVSNINNNNNISNAPHTYEISSSKRTGNNGTLFSGGNKKTLIYQGGSWAHLHAALNITAGEKVLYIGDHMYADIVRTKKSLGWRTCLIVPELERETAVASDKSVHSLGQHVHRMRSELLHHEDALEEMRHQFRRSRLISSTLDTFSGNMGTSPGPSSTSRSSGSGSSSSSVDGSVGCSALNEAAKIDTNTLSTISSNLNGMTGLVATLETVLKIKKREEEEQQRMQQQQQQSSDRITRSSSSNFAMLRTIADAEVKSITLQRKTTDLHEEFERKFHRNWGSLFRAGNHGQESRFAKQVVEYACLYTSKATNLVNFSPSRYFRPLTTGLPHDKHVESISDMES